MGRRRRRRHRERCAQQRQRDERRRRLQDAGRQLLRRRRHHAGHRHRLRRHRRHQGGEYRRPATSSRPWTSTCRTTPPAPRPRPTRSRTPGGAITVDRRATRRGAGTPRRRTSWSATARPSIRSPTPGSGALATSTLTIQTVGLDTFGEGYTSAADGHHHRLYRRRRRRDGASPRSRSASCSSIDLTDGGSGYVTPGGIRKFQDDSPDALQPGGHRQLPRLRTADPTAQAIPLARPRRRRSTSTPTASPSSRTSTRSPSCSTARRLSTPICPRRSCAGTCSSRPRPTPA